MSLDALGQAFKAEGLSPIEKLALIYLANAYADESGIGLVPELREIASFCGCGDDQARQALLRLFSAGHLRRVARPSMLFEEEGGHGIWFHMEAR